MDTLSKLHVEELTLNEVNKINGGNWFVRGLFLLAIDELDHLVDGLEDGYNGNYNPPN